MGQRVSQNSSQGCSHLIARVFHRDNLLPIDSLLEQWGVGHAHAQSLDSLTKPLPPRTAVCSVKSCDIVLADKEDGTSVHLGRSEVHDNLGHFAKALVTYHTGTRLRQELDISSIPSDDISHLLQLLAGLDQL